jgi:hypothetical protein
VTAGDPLGELDELDASILGELRAAHDRVDPPPADLDERVRFALRLADADVVSVFRRTEDSLAGAGAREGGLRTIAFEAGELTILLTVSANPDGTVRLEGWLAPAAPLRVEVRLVGSLAYQAVADADGRFGVASVPLGLAQLVVHQEGGGRLVTGSVALSTTD